MYTLIPAIFLLLSFAVPKSESGECCNAYYDATGAYQSGIWCPHFCCHHLGRFSCCDNFLLRAPRQYVGSFCGNWFTVNYWVPILITFVILSIIISIIVCCCCWPCFLCC